MLSSQRALFDIPRQVCYLNAASYSPLPLRTLEAGRAAVGRKGTPWTLPASFAGEQHERARQAAARLINADTADIALIPSISYGVATAAKLLTVARGTRVIVLEDDHSSPVLEWRARAEAQGFSVETVRQPRRRRLDVGGSRDHRTTGRAAGRPRLDLVGALVGRRTDRRRKGGRGAAAARRQIPDRRHAKRRRAGDGRQAPRSGFRDLPDLQMAARALRPRLPLRRQTPSGRHPARADRGRPPQRARRERRSISPISTTSAMPGASTWASAIISSRWRWPRSAWKCWRNGAQLRWRNVCKMLTERIAAGLRGSGVTLPDAPFPGTAYPEPWFCAGNAGGAGREPCKRRHLRRTASWPPAHLSARLQ